MNNRKLNVHVECGEIGVGKTTFVKQKWYPHLFVACGDPLNEIKTTGALFFALSNIYDTVSDDLKDIVEHLRKAMQDNLVIIIDKAENIDERLLEIIINIICSYPNKTLVVTFDISKNFLLSSKIFQRLLEWDIIPSNATIDNFCANTKEFSALIENHLPEASDTLKKQLIETANKNFNNLKNLLWLIANKQLDFSNISEEVIAEYFCVLVEKKLGNLPKDLADILKKSSIIGEIFQSCILESPHGFNVMGIRAYLEKLEATNQFIQSYLNNDVYQFITNKIHAGILAGIEPEEKVESQRILLQYYTQKLAFEKDGNKILEYLLQIKRLSNELGDYECTIIANKKLLFQYIKIKDIPKAREVLHDFISLGMSRIGDDKLYLFLNYYKISLDLNMGFFKKALDGLEDIQKIFPHECNLYWQYYYAKSLYGIGDVDASYEHATKLRDILQKTSIKPLDNQPIYALTYSLLATIQHHLGIDDCGDQYYNLALTHSKNKLKDQAIHFEILRKCDMYYTFEFSYIHLSSCISYFESAGKLYNVAEACVNLATEIMFHDDKHAINASEFYEKAIKIFSATPNTNLAYAQNNYALMYIIQYGDFKSALELLEKSLLIGMSAFTYMTIHLNICMCYLVLKGYDTPEFKQASQEFEKNYAIIKRRTHATQYEDIYMDILDILVMEHKEQNDSAFKQAEKLLAQQSSSFFIPILNDIKSRNSQDNSINQEYLDHKNFYIALNKHKIFLAEFRFWE